MAYQPRAGKRYGAIPRLKAYLPTKNDALNGKLEKLGRKKEKRQQQIDVLDRFIADLKEMRDMPVEFSGSLWNAFVEKLTIYPDGNAEFLFKNGAAITEEL